MRTVRYNVPMVRQRTSPICWLACATMILQFKRGRTLMADEVGQTTGDFRSMSVPREPHATTGNQETAELRRLGFTVTRSGELANRVSRLAAKGPPVPANEVSEELLYWILSAHGPFILRHNAGAFWYGQGNRPSRPGGGHAVVVTGINAERDIVYFNNPWGQIDVPTSVRSILGAVRRWERNSANKPFAFL